MATSAVARIARKSSGLNLVRNTFDRSAALSTAKDDWGNSRWASAGMFAPRDSDGNWTIFKYAVGIFSGVSIAVVGSQIVHENVIHCNSSDLRPASPEEIEKSPLLADNANKYSLLADSYRRQVFFNYERRIRLRSRPEKVFSYFASQRDAHGQPYMRPADLMRAVVPIFPPNDSNLIREGHLDGERSPGELSCEPSEFFMLFDTNGDGLISFSEYIFFVTLLSIPEKSFKTAFKMFDLNGNGSIDRDEFKEVMRKMTEKTRQGFAHHSNSLSSVLVSKPVEMNSGLVEYFFGKDGKRQLRHDDFEKFLRRFHEEIVRLEFAHYDYKQRGTISAHDFGLSLIAAADMNLLNEYLERAKVLLKNPFYTDMKISPEEFHNFAELRKKLRKLAQAMSSYGAMNKEDFRRACSRICNIPLSNAVVDVVFQIFDANQDGFLSSEEFLHAMDRRENDIASPTETGVVYLLKCWWKCSENCQRMRQRS